MSARPPCVVVLGQSVSTHARIPARMVREAGYRVVLANQEPDVAPDAHEFFDAVYSVETRTERLISRTRTTLRRTEAERPIKPMDILAPTRRLSLYARLTLGVLRAKRLAEVVQKERAGVVHVQGMDVGGMCAYYYLKSLGFEARRGPGMAMHLFSYQPRFAEIKKRESRLLKAADVVHTSSPVVARIYREHYGIPKVHLLVRGIDLKTFAQRNPAALAAARAEWGVPAGKFVLIHNRHLHPMYRVDIAVDAFIELAKRGHDVFLMLVRGSMWVKEYEDELLGRLVQNGLRDRVALMPHEFHAPQMATALQLADCSINTVPFDAFPVSILESMYCGAVPVVRDLESYYMFVREGETGFLCGGTGTEQYVEKIERLIREPGLKCRMVEAGAALVAAEGDVEIYRRRLIELIRQAWREW